MDENEAREDNENLMPDEPTTEAPEMPEVDTTNETEDSAMAMPFEEPEDTADIAEATTEEVTDAVESTVVTEEASDGGDAIAVTVNSSVKELETPEVEEVPAPEIEPTTVGTSEETVVTPVAVEDDTSEQPSVEAEPNTIAPVPMAASIATKEKTDKKHVVIIAACSALLLIFIGIIAWLLLSGNKNDDTNRTNNTNTTNQPTEVEQPKLGIVVTVADGTVEYMREEAEWLPVDTSTQLQEGDSVRTGDDSRAVLTLDDGSATRLDANTTVKIVSLAADDIQIEQVEGMVYSRVVPSERKYTVSVSETSYEALGTAFVTFKKPGESGVQVYQSAVRTSDMSETIAEGEQYYRASNDMALAGKVTDLDIDKLVDDKFVAWNMAEDQKDAKFKDSLGVLSKVKQRGEEKEKEKQEQARKAEEERKRLAAEKAAKEKKEAEEKKKHEHGSKEKVTRGAMSLSRNGSIFSWSYTGKAVHGYKLVYSTTGTPVFGAHGSESIHYPKQNMTSGSLPKKAKKGTYSVRVCAYTAGTENEGCVDYSPIVTITID